MRDNITVFNAEKRRMKMLDLFSGIGGFSLAAEWCWGKELEIVGFVEIDSYCQKVLNKHWPGAPVYPNIEMIDGTYWKVVDGIEIDLITGGFPCQDISVAGKGVGIEGERSGLWTEFKRIISECRPKFALIENVPALTHRGLDRVLCDLAEIGYDAEWQSMSASEVGAWHKRERIWIIAYPNRIRRKEKILQAQVAQEKIYETSQWEFCRAMGVAYIDKYNRDALRMVNGVSGEMDRLKSLGNAIVPQVAYIIMQQIKRIID